MFDWKEFDQAFMHLALRYDRHKVFDDLLDICICCFAMLPGGVSRYEEDYLAIKAKYRDEDFEYFHQLFARLIFSMEKYHHSSLGNDILGSYYETHLADKKMSQYFTPYPIARFMAEINDINQEKASSIIDPSCGSGRMLLAAAETGGKHHKFYGIDLSHYCVKMTVINMFLNGLQGEVMCANALMPDDFRIAYRSKKATFWNYYFERKRKL
jgi:type I restriction-modification system DNA methylase subunit